MVWFISVYNDVDIVWDVHDMQTRPTWRGVSLKRTRAYDSKSVINLNSF